MNKKKIESVIKKFSEKKIAVVGDVMLDKFIWGKITRVSPESPVPIIDVEKESEHLGGAANVAMNIKSLSSDILLFGIIGNDESGTHFKKILEKNKISTYGIVRDNRPTTVKTRIIAHNQHITRIDKEVKKKISEKTENKIFSLIKKKIDEIDAIILEDYNKGVLTENLISKIIDLSLKKNKIVTVDPKLENFFSYKNVFLFKPNTKEIENSLKIPVHTDSEIEIAGKKLLEKLNAKHILITRSENGMSLISRDGNIFHIPTIAKKIADVSGAGDTVIATLTLSLACGLSTLESAMLSNIAAGSVCEEIGVVPITKEKLQNSI